MNDELHQNIGYLNQLQYEAEPLFNPEFARLNAMDCNEVLSKAQKEIKLIQYHCNNAVVSEDEKLITLRPPGVGDRHLPGPEQIVDLFEEYPAVCRIPVLGRKAPLKIHFNYQYNNKPAQHVELLGEGEPQQQQPA